MHVSRIVAAVLAAACLPVVYERFAKGDRGFTDYSFCLRPFDILYGLARCRKKPHYNQSMKKLRVEKSHA